jgi:hypothetical protein
MKYAALFTLTIVLALLSCNEPQPKNTEVAKDAPIEFVPAEPGTVMAEESVAVLESRPNNFSFRVKVLANEYTKKGTYTIAVIYGPDSNASMFTMPKGAAHLLPEMKKGDGYNYIIGFTYMGKFYDYYEVIFDPGPPHRAKVSLVKAYVLE